MSRQPIQGRRMKAASLAAGVALVSLLANVQLLRAENAVCAPDHVCPKPEASADAGDTPFVITVDGETVDESRKTGAKPAVRAAQDVERKTDLQLEAVDIQVKFDGLDAKPLLNVSTQPVRRTYKAGEEVRFFASSNYPAFISRAEVRLFKSGEEKTSEPVSVIPVDPNGTASWVMPAAQRSTEGDDSAFSYTLRVYDEAGRFDETVPLTIARSERDLPPAAADVAVAPGVGEDRTATRNIQVYGGAVTVYGRNVPQGADALVLGETVPVDAEHSFVTQRILPPGDHQVDVAIKDERKDGGLDFSRSINIPKNDWFYIALADLTVGHRTGDANIEAVRPGEYDKVYTKGRLAFYLKGKIKGRYLLTAAADTGEDDIEDLFRSMDKKDPRHLLRRLDPDDYYPVYGDDSTAIEDAPTKGKFYVRLERGDSHVMWGNYKTVISGTQFIRSDRSLYGANAVYRSEQLTSFGERKTDVTLYAAQPDTLQQRDEFLGTGGSAYFLRQQDITVGSETIVVEIRNEISGRVIERRTLVYGEDYTFDYMQGVLILTRPLQSTTGSDAPVRDGALGGNKVYLVAAYEYTPLAGNVDGYAFGGRAQHWHNDNVRIGATAMSETTGAADQRAYGADIQIRKSEKTFFEAEVAESRGPGFSRSTSTDGGLTVSDVAAGAVTDWRGRAWRMKGQVALEEIPGSKTKGVVGGYYQEREGGFSTLSDQVDVDERIWGAHADVELTKQLTAKAAYDALSDAGGRRKSRGEGSVSYAFDEYWKASFGLTYTESVSPLALASAKSGYNGSRLDAGVRIDYTPSEAYKFYAFGQGTVDRTGDLRRNDRIGVGSEFQLTAKVDASAEISYGTGGVGGLAALTYKPNANDQYYAGYRLDPNRAYELDRQFALDGQDLGAIVVGARREISDSLSSYIEDSYDMYGRRKTLTQTYGVIYTPDAMWKVDAGLEAGRIKDDSIDPATGLERSDFDRKAASLSIGYNDEEKGIDARIRGEARFEESEDGTRNRDTYLFASHLGWKTSEDWRLTANLDAVLSNSAAGQFHDGDYVEASLGYAYRPVDSDRLNALFKYTWLYDLPGNDQVSAITGDRFGPAQRSHILSANASYDLLPWLTIGGKYGFRIGEVRYRDAATGTFAGWERSSAHLGVLRADIHFVKKWDALLEARVLHMPEAGTTDWGALAAVYRHVGENFKVGVGYNFGVFSDDLRDLTLDDQGVFLNVIGKW